MSSGSSVEHGSSSTLLPSATTPASTRCRESGLIRGSILSNLREDYDKDAFASIRDLLDTLHTAKIPGPHLLRMQTDFKRRIGRGAQGSVHAAHRNYSERLQAFAANHFSEHQSDRSRLLSRQIRQSHRSWSCCAIKQLRHDAGRKLESQVATAVNEVKRLCNGYAIKSKYVVTLQGWGLDLDALENYSSSTPRLPLLVFERAECDLAAFIDAADYDENAPFQSWNDDQMHKIALDIGRGLQAIHKARMCHGDVKPDNVLVFYSDSTWHAKVCDLGSATDATKLVPADCYLGTNGWKAPETLMGKRLIDVIRCDVFSYGLVILSMFMKTSRSLIGDYDPDDLVDGLGEQRIYAAAKLAVSQIYHDHENSSRGSATWQRSVDRNEERRYTGDSIVHRRLYKLFTTFFTRSAMLPSLSKSVDLGPNANRLLMTLKSCLDEQPEMRGLEPWKLFLPAINIPRQVQDPEPFERQYPSAFPSPPSVHSANTAATWIQSFLVAFESSSIWLKHQWVRMQVAVPFFQPSSPRQTAFLKFHAIFADILGPDVSKIHTLQHNGPDCIMPSQQALAGFHRKMSSLSRVNADVLQLRPEATINAYVNDVYLLARLRSRFELCC